MVASPNTRSQHLFRLIVAIHLVVAVFAGSLGGVVFARAVDPPLDLAAMTLRPGDLETELLTGFWMSWSLLGPESRTVAEFVEGWGWDARVDDGQAFRDAGAGRSYLLHLARERDENGWISSDALVASFVLEYDDAAAAEEGFAAASAVWEETLETSSPDVEIGDEQVLFVGTGIDTSSGLVYERMLLLFRMDDIVSGVSFHDFAGEQAPEQAVVENLAKRQAGLIESVRDGDAPGFSGQVVRLRVDDGYLFNWDYYVADGGEANRLAATTETDDEFAERRASYDETGLTERYHLEQIVAGDEDPTGPAYAWFNVTIDRYAGEDAAVAAMDDIRATVDEDETAVLQDAPDLGDESIAYTSVNDSGNERYRIVVRTGDTVFRLSHVTDPGASTVSGHTFEPQPEAINDLAEQQLACLEGESSCEQPVRIPDAMLGAPE